MTLTNGNILWMLPKFLITSESTVGHRWLTRAKVTKISRTHINIWHKKGKFSVPLIEYPLRGSSKNGSHIYFLLEVFCVILLFDTNYYLFRYPSFTQNYIIIFTSKFDNLYSQHIYRLLSLEAS